MDLLLDLGKKNLGKLVKAGGGGGMNSYGINGSSSNNQYYEAPTSNYGGYPGNTQQPPYQQMNSGYYAPQNNYGPSFIPHGNANYGAPYQNQPYFHQQTGPYGGGYGGYQPGPNYYPPHPSNAPPNMPYQQSLQPRPQSSKSSPLNVLDLDHDGMVTANGYLFYFSIKGVQAFKMSVFNTLTSFFKFKLVPKVIWLEFFLKKGSLNKSGLNELKNAHFNILGMRIFLKNVLH